MLETGCHWLSISGIKVLKFSHGFVDYSQVVCLISKGNLFRSGKVCEETREDLESWNKFAGVELLVVVRETSEISV